MSMKYLKSYNESINNISQEIREILSSLRDIGLQTTCQAQEKQVVVIITCFWSWEPKRRERITFSFNEIKDEVNHLISTLEENGNSLIKAEYRIENQGWFSLYKESESKPPYDIFINNKGRTHNLDSSIEWNPPIDSFSLIFHI